MLNKNIIIACGGGGVPVIEKDNTYEGVGAVVIKTSLARKLAALIDADALMILTSNGKRCILILKEPNEEKLTDIDVGNFETLRERENSLKDQYLR